MLLLVKDDGLQPGTSVTNGAFTTASEEVQRPLDLYTTKCTIPTLIDDVAVDSIESARDFMTRLPAMFRARQKSRLQPIEGSRSGTATTKT